MRDVCKQILVIDNNCGHSASQHSVVVLGCNSLNYTGRKVMVYALEQNVTSITNLCDR